MSAAYTEYLEHLASNAAGHAKARAAERTAYPLFRRLKSLIGRYATTISKFSNVQGELVRYVGQLEFSEGDLEEYHERFEALRKLDGYLEELRTKQVGKAMTGEVLKFTSEVYSAASLYQLEADQQRVLGFHNKTAEVARSERQEQENASAQMRAVIIGAVVIGAVLLLVGMCNS